MPAPFPETQSQAGEPGETRVLPEPITETRTAVDRPWQVVVWDDPINLMSYVVYVFQKLFGYSTQKATKHMLEVHTKGKGICGVFNYEIAETKVAQVMTIANQHQHPLLCTMEES